MNIPALHGNWIDLAIILIVIFYLWGGWGRGFILGIIDLWGFLFSFFAALKFYSVVGGLIVNNFSLSVGIANASGFLLSGIIAEIVFSLSINYLYIRSYRKVTEKIKDKKKFFKIVRIDKILGFIPATGEAMIFTAFILTLFITLPVAGSIKKDILSSKVGGPLVSHTQIVERQLNSIFGAAVNETLTFLTINASPSSGEKVDLKFTTSDIKIDEGAESTMLNLINSERGKMNLQHLSVSFPLRELARYYAKDMFGR